jgi:hypothetical protein
MAFRVKRYENITCKIIRLYYLNSTHVITVLLYRYSMCFSINVEDLQRTYFLTQRRARAKDIQELEDFNPLLDELDNQVSYQQSCVYRSGQIRI